MSQHPPGTPRESADRTSPLIDTAAGLILAAGSMTALLWLVPNHTEPSVSEYDVSPAFFPSLSAWVVLGLSLLHLAPRARHLVSGDGAADGRRLLFDIATWTLIGGLTALGLARVGFLVTAPLLIGIWMIAAGRRSWWQILLLATLFPLTIDRLAWVIFTVDLP